MAKAREIPDLSGELPFAAAAARVVSVRAGELFEQAHDVLDVGDIERVHDMRVATRRLRAALEIFRPCFSRASHKDALREVKAIADALGERRDRDVAIASLEEFAATLPAPDRPGIASLAARLRADQAHANEALAPFVARERLDALRGRLAGLVHEAEGLAAAGGNGAGP